MTPRALIAVVGCALAIASCGETVPRTQIMVVVGLDDGLTARATSIDVRVRGFAPGATSADTDNEARYVLEGADAVSLPIQVAVVPLDGDVERSVRVDASALEGDAAITTARAETRFLAERTLVLHLFLTESCEGVVCADSESCRAGSCGSIAVDPNTLPELGPDGELPDAGSLDGGAPDAGPGLDAGPPCDTDACPRGCRPGTTECVDLIPHNVGEDPTLERFPGTATIRVESDTYFEATTGEIVGGITRPVGTGDIGGIYFEIISQPDDAPSIGVFAFASLEIAEGVTVRFRDESAVGPVAPLNSVVLLSAGDLVVAGTVDASASLARPGPGGGLPGGDVAGRGRGGSHSAMGSAGGGGGGNAGVGGDGGDSLDAGGTVTAAGGEGGAMMADGVSPLIGGGAGGPTEFMAITRPGGAGGGALQLTSRTAVIIRPTGILRAHGGGGPGRLDMVVGGVGGGAGGMIVLEAPRVEMEVESDTVAGALYANGGGGAGGRSGQDGQDGPAAASGGVSTDPPTGGVAVGGVGSTVGSLVGEPGASAPDRFGGGGGGAAGRIVIISEGVPLLSSLRSPGDVATTRLPAIFR